MLIEHLFAGEIMRFLWLRHNARVELLKPQVDDSGYDLVLEANRVVRHVQLKSSHALASTGDVKVSLSLAGKPSGCVVWLLFDESTMTLGPFLWLGSDPGKPLPNLSGFKVAKHTKGTSKGVKLPRPNLRVVPRGAFMRLPTVDDLVLRLFGPLKAK
jgi:hypothetical protein